MRVIFSCSVSAPAVSLSARRCGEGLLQRAGAGFRFRSGFSRVGYWESGLRSRLPASSLSRSFVAAASGGGKDRPPTPDELKAMYEGVDRVIDDIRAQKPRSVDMRGLFEGSNMQKDLDAGKITQENVATLFEKHKRDARKNTPEALAKEFGMDIEVVESVLAKYSFIDFTREF